MTEENGYPRISIEVHAPKGCGFRVTMGPSWHRKPDSAFTLTDRVRAMFVRPLYRLHKRIMDPLWANFPENGTWAPRKRVRHLVGRKIDDLKQWVSRPLGITTGESEEWIVMQFASKADDMERRKRMGWMKYHLGPWLHWPGDYQPDGGPSASELAAARTRQETGQ